MFGLICGDISGLLKNTGLEKVMLEHPKVEVRDLKGQVCTERSRDSG